MDVCAGIDIGGTNTELGLVSADGSVLWLTTFPTRSMAKPEMLLGFCTDALRKIISEKKLVLKGIGIGAPSGNYYTGSIEHAPNMPWPGIIPLADMFRGAMDVPVVLTNDANAAAIGEMFFGAAKGLRDFAVITLGTGLGSGIVTGGEVLYGHDGFAGELGHVIIEHEGRLCGCGRRGCLETYVSATGIVNTAKEWLEFEGEPTTLKTVSQEKIDSIMITDAAKAGDAFAMRLINYTAEKLGLALANLVAITSPSHIFLYGGLANAGDILMNATRSYFEKSLLKNYAGKVKIEFSGLPGNAAVIGAAALAWNEKRAQSSNR
ncbi:MAG TPA: ROK family protein [Bacteroidia bacterium]|nr:ROK family protein [Bacteroidia bacterium]